MRNKVYIFRGGPASGKSTLTKEFCKLLNRPVALIEQDKLRWGFHLIGRNVSEVSEAEHRFANNNTKILFEEYIKQGNYNVVIEGLFTWEDSQSSQGSAIEYIQIAEKYGYKPIVILLKADKAELQRRNDAREYSVPEDEFNQLNKGVYELIGDHEVIVDTSERSILHTMNSLEKLI